MSKEMATPGELCYSPLGCFLFHTQEMWCSAGMEQRGREKWGESALNLEGHKLFWLLSLELLQNCCHRPVAWN